MYGITEGEVDIIVDGRVVVTLKKGDVFGQGALVQPNYTRASTAPCSTFLDLKWTLWGIASDQATKALLDEITNCTPILNAMLQTRGKKIPA